VVTDAKRDSVTFTIPDNAPEGVQKVVITSGDRVAEAEITITAEPANASFSLDRKKAARGETVTATTTGIDLSSASLSVAGQEVNKEVTGEGTFTFKIPDSASAGPQTVTLKAKEGNLEQPLGVLGDVVADKLTLLLKPEVTESQLREVLGRLGFELDTSILDPFRNLGATEGPCASALADIDVGGKPLGQAIEELEKEGITLQIDPRAKLSSGAVDHLSAISASIARNNGFTGAGSTIAVLDTGVNPHSELTGRLVSPFNAIDNNTNVTDEFDDANVPTIPVDKRQAGIEGHGTPIAVLAAGSSSGVAPAASIMPVKTCNENGECFSSDVIVGMCHALTAAKDDLDNLILNLSFGGDTPVDALQAVMQYALEKGVQIAAAAGNEGEQGSPVHYPAAFKLDGLVAVGALGASTLQCVDFQTKDVNTRYDAPVPNQEPPVTFQDNGRTVGVEGLQSIPDAPPVVDGDFAIIEDEGQAGSIAPDIQLSGTRLIFNFDSSVDGVSLRYGDYAQSEGFFNVAVNDELEIFTGSLSDLDGRTLGRATVSAKQDIVILEGSPFPLPTGTLRLSGTVERLTIGAESLWLDDICPLQSSAWQPAVFSTRGDYVDISAPGAGLRSGTPSNAYANAYQGTSFSTPLVAGAMALWKQADPNLSPAQIEANLKRDVTPLKFSPSEVGAGMLNLNVAPFNAPPVPPLVMLEE
jgi:subtilisin